MASQPRPISPRAGACIALGWEFAERFPTQRCLAYTGFISGLALGMALSHIDPEWARQAYDELSTHQSEMWGNSGMAPQVKRLEMWKEAQELIRTARSRRYECGGEEVP